MWACTYGIDRWMPAKLANRLTAKLVVVNLVNLHLTKFNKKLLFNSGGEFEAMTIQTKNLVCAHSTNER